MILRTMSRHRRSLFVATAAIFLIGIFVGLGGYLFTSRDLAESVAVVGSTKIPYMKFNARVNRYLDALRQRGTEATDAQVAQIKGETLRDMIVDEVLAQQAAKMGLSVTDLELSAAIRSSPSFQRDGRFDQMLYFQRVREALRVSPDEYERDQGRAMLAGKLKQLLFESSKILPGELAEEYRREKGSMKDFEKNSGAFEQELERTRALDLVNLFLRQAASQMDIRQFLQQRESGQ